jgi:DNA-binding NarL/FixJ family response regulator
MTTRVVVADDSPQFLELLLVLLAEIPHLEVVGTASDGAAAVRAVVDRRADVALLDVEMPVLDGFAAARSIRRLSPQTMVVLHTAELCDERRRRGYQLNLDVFDKLDLARTLDVVAHVGEVQAA